MTDDPAKSLIEATNRYNAMLAANIAASELARQDRDALAPLHPVETSLAATRDHGPRTNQPDNISGRPR